MLAVVPHEDQPLSVGMMSRLCGLSIGALRHYDAEEVLRPSAVDAAPGYRRYARDQVAIGRLVADLRFLQLGLGDIRTYLFADADHRTSWFDIARAWPGTGRRRPTGRPRPSPPWTRSRTRTTARSSSATSTRYLFDPAARGCQSSAPGPTKAGRPSTSASSTGSVSSPTNVPSASRLRNASIRVRPVPRSVIGRVT